MGCVADKPIPEHRGFSTCKPAASNPFPVPPPKESMSTYKILEAIKKRDIILLRKAIHQFQIKPSEVLGPVEQAKTVLHKLAENNFSEGMAFILEELASYKSIQPSRILNMKDIDGNTPLLLCCLSDAVETLEVLSRSEHVDVEAKNFAKKTALEIAMEMESPCINVLTSLTAPTTKATLKSCGEGSQQLRSLEEASKANPNEKEEDLNLNTRTSLDGGRSNVLSSKDLQESQSPKDIQVSSLELATGRLCQVLSDLKTKDTNFIDDEFPHEMCYLEDEAFEGTLISKYPNLRWVRSSSITSPTAKQTIYEYFDLSAVTKTPLAGCEIYSAFAAMAEFPQRLAKVFTSKDVNKQGAYSVNLTVSGMPIEILLDDYFPSTNGTQPLYSKPEGNELWFSLLEKAFAKLHGGYSGLETIGILEALEALTGMPVAQRSLKDAEEDKLWAKLMDYDKRNYIVCAGEAKRYQNSFKNRIFTVVGIAEVNQYKIVKLRNHFGGYSWEGDFSCNSPLWTKEIREETGYCLSDTSCFYMDIKDFIREFEFLTVCHYHDGWVHSRLNAECKPNHPTYFELDVDKEIEAYISVHQKSPKFIEDSNGYDISPVEIILAKDLDGQGLESIAFGEHDAFLGKSAVYIHESHKVKLQPGKYMIYVKIKWVDNKTHDFFLNVLSSLQTKVIQATPAADFDFLGKVYVNAGNASKEKFLLPNDTQFASGWCGSHLWMYVHNRSNKILHFEVTFDKLRSIKLGKKFRTELNIIKFVVPANQKAAAYAKRTSPAAVSVGWEFAQRWE